MNANPLLDMVQGIAQRKIRVVDLTQTLSPDFPQIELPPEMGQCWPFRMEEVSRYDDRGSAPYWNNFSCGEHSGTHFDAPIHWVSGRNLPYNSTDTVPVENMVAPAVVIDCVKQVAQNPDFLLTADHLRQWEEEHGRIPAGAWVLMHTDWSKRKDPEAYQNFDDEGQEQFFARSPYTRGMVKLPRAAVAEASADLESALQAGGA